MKNKIAVILISALVLIPNVYAEEEKTVPKTTTETVSTLESSPPVSEINRGENTSNSKWRATEPITKITSEGLIVNASFKENTDNNITIVVTIPEDYESESIVINPDFFGEIAKELKNRTAYVIPGDSFYFTLTIINNSKYEYNYDEKSFDIFPSEQKEYKRVTTIDNSMTFNGLYPTELNQFIRVINAAYRSLGFYSSSQLTDTAIDNKLKSTKKINENNNYNGIADLSMFMLDFYNDHYGTLNTKLEQFSNTQIEKILGGNNTINLYNYTLEDDPSMIALHYNYFYNVLVGFTVDGSELSDNYVPSENKTTYPTEDNSIGSYMRDDTKGEEIIKSKIGSLKPSTEASLDNMIMVINNEHTKNAYMCYEFDMEMQLSFTASKGKVVVSFVDENGKILLDDEITTDMIGKDYKTSPKTINGYKLIKVNGNETGKYATDTTNVAYVYQYVVVEGAGEDPEIVKPVNSIIPYTGIEEKDNTILNASLLGTSFALTILLIVYRKKLI